MLENHSRDLTWPSHACPSAEEILPWWQYVEHPVEGRDDWQWSIQWTLTETKEQEDERLNNSRAGETLQRESETALDKRILHSWNNIQKKL